MARPYLVVTGDFVRTGGMDRANYALAKHLAQSGHETHLVSFRVADDLAREPNARVHLVPKPPKSGVFGGPLLGSRALLEIAKLPSGAEVVVNGGNCPAAGSVNWVHYVHAAAEAVADETSASPRPLRWIMRSTERVAIRRARLVLTNSERTRNDVITLLGVDPSRVEVVYLGVDADDFRPRTDDERAGLRSELGWSGEGNGDRPKAVFIGALGDRRKGFDTLFAAWKRLCASSSWDADLVVVGEGAGLAAMRERTREANLASRISFLGLRSDVARILGAADLLVAPTRYEPYGLAVHEALCSAVPAITSAAAGVAERYPESLRGWLLPDPNDDVDLAARLTRWRESPRAGAAALHELSSHLRARTWDVVARDMIARMENPRTEPRTKR